MTTAARPTFEPARGGTGKGEGDLSALSKQYSSRDLPAHTKLKYRYVNEMCSGNCYRQVRWWNHHVCHLQWTANNVRKKRLNFLPESRRCVLF